jgi:inorganic pyrophosphatase
MIDSGEDDYKIIAVADDKYYAHVQDISDVHEKELEDIAYYMLHYKDLHGKTIELNGWDTKDIALARVSECHDAYKSKFAK